MIFDAHIHQHYAYPDDPVKFLANAKAGGVDGGNIFSEAPSPSIGSGEGDYRWKARLDKVLEFTMSEVMTKNPVSIQKDALAVEVLKILEQRRIDDIVVTDSNGIVCGFIDVQDLPGLKIM